MVTMLLDHKFDSEPFYVDKDKYGYMETKQILILKVKKYQKKRQHISVYC